MSLIVEDGTGLVNAESYISVANADARLSNLGITNWSTLLTAEKEQALRRATQYMLQAYRQRWTGNRVKVDPPQALDWPRYGVEVDGFPVHFDVVPTDIANTCADLAFKAASGDLNADLTRGVIRKKVGPLETDYDRFSPQAVRYRAIDMALAPYLKGSSATAMLVRS
jgi:DnaT-like ssDNA binding protein